MIVPSIDLQGGRCVQLIGGRELAVDAGDPRPIARRFGRVGEVAVVDLDAAMGRGDNSALIRELCELAPCRVGGGIRDVETALRWLDDGACRVVLGTAATPEVLVELPRERVVAALDARDGEVVVAGWQRGTGRTIEAGLDELRGLVSGFLVTFVEREGRMGGTDHARARELVRLAGDARLTVAGGIATAREIAELDRIGADAQVGMALYTGEVGLAEAFAAPLTADREDGLWPTVVTDECGAALGLAWSDLGSLSEALATARGVYRSRTRGLWVKGETSGAVQELLAVAADCDRDALRFTVRQAGAGFCHRGTWTCWGADRGWQRLAARLSERLAAPAPGSYTRRLAQSAQALRAKLVEEAAELADASDPTEVRHEAADLLYFATVALARAGVTPAEVARELDRRALRVRHRGTAEEAP